MCAKSSEYIVLRSTSWWFEGIVAEVVGNGFVRVGSHTALRGRFGLTVTGMMRWLPSGENFST
jgi:hypothetical protein